MRLANCVGCAAPVLELVGQFALLDSYLIEDGSPPPASAGWWHLTCLQASETGPTWYAARLRNYQVRGFQPIVELARWTVIQDRRRGATLALGHAGELVELSCGGRKHARRVEGGVVVPRVEDEFHLDLADAAAVQAIQDGLTARDGYPVLAVCEVLGIRDRLAHPEALAEGEFRLDRGLRQLWSRHAVSARLEYGVFVPDELEYIGSRLG